MKRRCFPHRLNVTAVSRALTNSATARWRLYESVPLGRARSRCAERREVRPRLEILANRLTLVRVRLRICALYMGSNFQPTSAFIAVLWLAACGSVRVREVGSGLDRQLELRCPRGEESCDRVARKKCDGEYYLAEEARLPEATDGVLWKVACGVHQLRGAQARRGGERIEEVSERTLVNQSIRPNPKPTDVVAAPKLEAPSPTTAADAVLHPTQKPQRSQAVNYGTCFAISRDGYVLTAHHVVSGGTELRVHFKGKDGLSARVLAQSEANDWALLKVPVSTPNFLPVVSTKGVDSGTRVFTFGYPVVNLLGSEAKYTEGAISALSGLRGESSEMQVQVPIQSGNSGGPLLTANGEVVGIVVSSVADKRFAEMTESLPQLINFAVKSDMFIASLPKLTARPPLAVTPVQIRDRARAATCLLTAVVEEQPWADGAVSPPGPFSKAAAVLALRAAAERSGRCVHASAPRTTSRVQVTFAPTGAVLAASLTGPHSGTPAGLCIESEFKQSRVPAFTGAMVTVSKQVVVGSVPSPANCTSSEQCASSEACIQHVCVLRR